MNRMIISAAFAFLICTAAAASPVVESELRARGDQFAAAWNKHDPTAMAAFWAPDGDLINPYGRVAKGKAEVEKLFREEHAAMLKTSTYKNLTSSFRVLSPDLALADWEIEISGAVGPDGKVMPAGKTHVTVLYKKSAGQWWVVSARAFDFLKPPPAPKKK